MFVKSSGILKLSLLVKSGIVRANTSQIFLAQFSSRHSVHNTKRSAMASSANATVTLETLNFDNLALRTLPIDPNSENTIREVPGACFSRVEPTPVANPETVAYSSDAMSLLDLSETELQRPDFAQYFSGNKKIPGSETAAHCYCGHQFGYFSGQLGDGAAMYLGEVVNNKGERWEMQFKGSGTTPYSRHADGRKVLRSSIREFLCSEAMHRLGVPTTRAGSCVTSDTKIVRDIFYDGNPINERVTIISRIAPTFLRFGSFEIFKPLDSATGRKGPSVGHDDILVKMLHYTIQQFFPQVYESYNEDKQKMYLEFYKEVIRMTAQLVVCWQSVGFCHGVLNTDNMSIVGLTIDYGPFGFLDTYDPDHICNGSDDGGRYTYQKQPEICRWNLEKLGEAISGALPLGLSKPELKIYDEEYDRCYMQKMRKKLGLGKNLPEDRELIDSLLKTMSETGADFTNCFRCLSQIPMQAKDAKEDQSALDKVKVYLLSQCRTLEQLKTTLKPKMDPREMSMLLMLLQSNPSLFSQLGRGQLLRKEIEKLEKSKELENLTGEEKKRLDEEKWTAWLNSYRLRLQQELESVDNLAELNSNRVTIMNSSNPKFILRNYIAQNAITAAESGDFSEVRRVLKLLKQPYSQNVQFDGMEATVTDKPEESLLEAARDVERSAGAVTYDLKPPDWAYELSVT